MSNDGTYKHDSVSPIIVELANDSRVEQGGLTKREYFAGLAMQGILSNASGAFDPKVWTSLSVKYADALIKALNEAAE